jgi:hypothetical protein
MTDVVHGGVPRLVFENHLNTTCIASRHKMFKSVLKMGRALEALAAKEAAADNLPRWEMSSEAFL